MIRGQVNSHFLSYAKIRQKKALIYDISHFPMSRFLSMFSLLSFRTYHSFDCLPTNSLAFFYFCFRIDPDPDADGEVYETQRPLCSRPSFNPRHFNGFLPSFKLLLSLSTWYITNRSKTPEWNDKWQRIVCQSVARGD